MKPGPLTKRRRRTCASPQPSVKRLPKSSMSGAVVQDLAATWGCSRHDAVKLWVAINRDVQPYLHQTLPRAVGSER